MKKEDIEKEKINLELEKIKIRHQNELEYTRKKSWEYTYLITLLLLALYTVISNLLRDNPGALGAFTVSFLVYFALFVFVNDWKIDKDFLGKPSSPTAWIAHILFFIWLIDILKYKSTKKKQHYKHNFT